MPKKKNPAATDWVAVGDAELSKAFRDISEEMQARILRERHALRLDGSVDLFAAVRGQEAAKRALAVAMCGDFTILFYGAPGTGKTMLRRAAASLGFFKTFEIRSCPCGRLDDLLRECVCTQAEVKRFRQSKWPTTVLSTNCSRVSRHEFESTVKGTGVDHMRQWMTKRIDVQADKRELVKDAAILLSQACSELGLDARERAVAIQVAKTIAFMEESEMVCAQHVAEAINYTPLQRFVT